MRSFVKLGQFDEHFVQEKNKKGGFRREKSLEFFLLDTLTTTFLIELLTQKWTQDLFFQNQGTLRT